MVRVVQAVRVVLQVRELPLLRLDHVHRWNLSLHLLPQAHYLLRVLRVQLDLVVLGFPKKIRNHELKSREI